MSLRKSLAAFAPEWVEEAIAAAVDCNDPHAICAAVVAALEARIAVARHETAELNRQTDAKGRDYLARLAAYEIAMSASADLTKLTTH